MTSPPDEPTAPDAPTILPGDRKRIALLLLPLGLLVGVSMLGTALAPTLLGRSPLALLALNPTWRHILLVVPVIDLVPMMAVVVPRLVAPDPFMYVLGRDHGDQAIAALTTQMQMGEQGTAAVRRLDGFMRRWSWVGVMLWPVPVVCAMAGAARLPWPIFLTLGLAHRVAWVLLWRWAGEAIPGHLAVMRDFIDRNASAATVVSVALVLAFGLRALSRRPAAEPGQE